MHGDDDALARLYDRWVTAIGVIVFLVGVTIFLVGYFKHQPLVEKVGEFLLLIVSLHFLYEHCTRKGDRQVLTSQLQGR